MACASVALVQSAPASHKEDRTLLKQAPPANAANPKQGRKIAIFVDTLNATGVVRNAVAIANRMDSDGWRVGLVAARAEGHMRASLQPGITVHQLAEGAVSRLSRRRRLVGAIRGYRRFLRAFQPDVLLSAGNHGHLPTLLAAGAAPYCKTVFRISNDIEHRQGRKSKRSLSRLVRRIQLRLVVKRADLMVLVSPHLQHNPVIRGVAAGRVTVIDNGVDVEAVRRDANLDCDHPWLSNGSEVPVVLGVGRFVTQKNLPTLIQAVAAARDVRPMRLLLIGSGPLNEELQGEIDRLGVGDCVAIIPPVANPMPYISRAAVLALPSWWEGASNVLLEAIACGTPVVASETAGSAAMVLGDGKYGVLVDPADVSQIADAILRQSSEFAVRPEKRASDFSIVKTLEAYSTAFRDLGAHHGPLPGETPTLGWTPVQTVGGSKRLKRSV